MSKKGHYKRESPKEIHYSTRMTQETKNQLQELAKILDKSQSEVLADLIAMGLEHFRGNFNLAKLLPVMR